MNEENELLEGESVWMDAGNIDPAALEPNFSQFDALNMIQTPTNPSWVKNKKGLDYVSGDTVIRMLNKAFKYRWSYYVLETRVVSSQDKYDKFKKETVTQGAVVQAHGRLVVPGWGVREQWGSQPLVGGSDVQEHAFKSAATDALKKCASMFGIALDLYGQAGMNELSVGVQDYITNDEKMIQNFKDQIRRQFEARQQAEAPEATVEEPVKTAPTEEPHHYQAEPDLTQAVEQPRPEVVEPAMQQQQQQAQQPAPEVVQEPVQQPVAGPVVEQPMIEQAPPKTGTFFEADDINALKQFKADKSILHNNELDVYVQEFLNTPEATYYNIAPNNIKDFLTFLATK